MIKIVCIAIIAMTFIASCLLIAMIIGGPSPEEINAAIAAGR